jgi:hypothetical protein
MTSPIARIPATGGVAATREVSREEPRDTERGGARRREGPGGAAGGAGDQVSLSPQALRGPGGGDADEQSTGGSGASETADSAAVAFRDGSEALLAARGLASALHADRQGAARVHALISPLRAQALLRS